MKRRKRFTEEVRSKKIKRTLLHNKGNVLDHTPQNELTLSEETSLSAADSHTIPRSLTDDHPLLHVAKFLPIYNLLGERSAHLVSRRWNEVLKSSTLVKIKKNKREFIESFQETKAGLYWLADKTVALSERFLLEDYFKLIGSNFEITQNVLKNLDELHLDKVHIVSLGMGSLASARLILASIILCAEMDGDDFVALGLTSVDHARLIFTNFFCRGKLEVKDIIKLGQEFIEITQLILATPTLYKGFNSTDWLTLGLASADHAEILLTTESILPRLDEMVLKGLNLKRMEKNDTLNAENILNEMAFEPGNLSVIAFIGSKIPALRTAIMANEELLNQFSGDELTDLGLSSLEVTERIMASKVLCNELTAKNLVALAGKFPSFNEKILTESVFYKKMEKYIGILGSASLARAEQMLANKSLYPFNGDNLVDLGKGSCKIAKQILADPELNSKLSSDHKKSLQAIIDMAEKIRLFAEKALEKLEKPASFFSRCRIM